VFVGLAFFGIGPSGPGARADAPKPDAAAAVREIDDRMQALAGKGFAGVVLVARRGTVLLEKGYGWADQARKVAVTPETGFDIGSVTKPFTAAAILKLEEEGKLRVTDPLGKYFATVPEDKAAITLHHLLTHTAGLQDVFGDDYALVSRDELVAAVLRSKLIHAPGGKFRYSNAGYSLLGAVVEVASGMPYEKYVAEHLLRPAGMTRTGYLLPRWKKEELATGYRRGKPWGTPLDHAWADDGPSWNLRANGGMLSTAGDLFRWVSALEGDRVLSRKSRDRMFERHAVMREGKQFYGYGWGIVNTARGTRMINHTGGNDIFHADCRLWIDEGFMLIVLSSVAEHSAIDVAPRLAPAVLRLRPAGER
jgi:CubicO group peptidase (beta-lactamase class C family)